MAKKKSQQPDPGRQTKKQIAMGRKQARQNRIIYIALGAFALVVILILAIGLIIEGAVRPAEAVATVNGEKIRTDEFQELLTYSRYNQHLTILNLQQALQEIDPEEEGNEFLVSFYEQQVGQLQSDLALAPQTALDELIEDKLIQEKAADLGITVTDADVSQTIDQDLRQAAAPPAQVPVTDTEELPAPTPIPQEQLDEFYNNALSNMGLSDSAFRAIVARRLLRQRVQEQLASEVITTGLVANVKLIETETAEEAAEAQSRIESGEDFAIVAQEVSTDTLTAAGGGDLGWVTPDQISSRYGSEVQEAAFSAEIGTLVIAQSGDMYYLISVAERDENGPLPDSIVGQLQNGALATWLEERKADPSVTIERLLSPEQIPEDPFAQPIGF
jgi:parvulin-like peptidyl-prolyl isomerase